MAKLISKLSKELLSHITQLTKYIYLKLPLNIKFIDNV